MSANLERDRTHLVRWLDECGLSSTEGSVSVTLVTDSEQSVSTFVARSSGKYHFLVRKAGPQVHEQNGGVENAVRSLKQSFKTLQSDFETMRASVDFRPEVIQLILNYCCFSHNIHGLAFGSERSPREIAVSRRLPVGEFAMFGSKVLAEIPKSVEQLNPNLTRFVSDCYLHPQFSSCGSLVLARIRVKDELAPKIFVAKSLKLVFPIELDFESEMFVVLKLKGEEGPKALDFDRSLPSDVSRVLPSNQGVSLKCPPSGPPKEFIDRYGISPDCKACRSIDEIGTRKGFSHSKSCCRRYEDWLRIQVQGQEVGEPVVRDSLGKRWKSMHLQPQKRKKKFCLGMGTLKLIYHLLLLRGLKPVTVRPAKRVWMFQVLDIPKIVLNETGRFLGNLPFLVCPMMKFQRLIRMMIRNQVKLRACQQVMMLHIFLIWRSMDLSTWILRLPWLVVTWNGNLTFLWRIWKKKLEEKRKRIVTRWVMFCLAWYRPLSGFQTMFHFLTCWLTRFSLLLNRISPWWHLEVKRLRFGNRPRRLMILTCLSCLAIKLMMGW